MADIAPNREILVQLISDLIAARNMLIVIDSHGAVAEMHTREMEKPELHDQWAMLKSKDWHVHLDLRQVDETQFVEAEDRMHDDIPKLYYVRFSDVDGNTLIRFYFPNPWLDENEKATEFQPEKLRLFEEFRDRFVGIPGIIFAQRH